MQRPPVSVKSHYLNKEIIGQVDKLFYFLFRLRSITAHDLANFNDSDSSVEETRPRRRRIQLSETE